MHELFRTLPFIRVYDGAQRQPRQCAHACRWKYKLYLEEEQRPGEFLPVEEDNRGTYIMNSKDLCLMPKLDLILNAGIDLLKIEGRNKTPYYVAQTARAYRKAIDDWFDNPGEWRFEPYQAELDTLQNRGYTTGFSTACRAVRRKIMKRCRV